LRQEQGVQEAIRFSNTILKWLVRSSYIHHGLMDNTIMTVWAL